MTSNVSVTKGNLRFVGAGLLIMWVVVAVDPAVGQKATPRPIEDFVNAQGTFCLDFETFCEGDPPCDLFVPPTENFMGWSDPNVTPALLASVDYAGLADKWITEESKGEVTFNTQFSGSITERPLKDGRAEVHVRLKTTNALIWAVEAGELGFNEPLIFGWRAPDVLDDGKEPSLGTSHYEIKFINTAPGDPLPDILQVAFCPEEGQEITFIRGAVNVRGTFRELYGVPEGTPGHMQITQTGLFMTGFHGAVEDGFPAEHIKLREVGK